MAATVSLEVIDPSGATALDAEVAVGIAHAVEFEADKTTWTLALETSLHEAALRVEGSLVRLGRKAGKRDGFAWALGPGVRHERTVQSRDGTWQVAVEWAQAIAPPDASVADGVNGRSAFLLLWDDTRLYANPRAQGAWEVETELSGGRTQPALHASPFKAIDAWGTRYHEVETVPEPGDPHCATGHPPLLDYPYQYFAANADAVQVTTAETRLQFGDGTGWRLMPGVPIEGESGGEHVQLGGLRVPVQVPPEHRGIRYVPLRTYHPVETGWVLEPTADGVLGHMGGAPVRASGPTPVHGLQGVRERLVTVQHRCGEVTFVPAGALVPPG